MAGKAKAKAKPATKLPEVGSTVQRVTIETVNELAARLTRLEDAKFEDSMREDAVKRREFGLMHVAVQQMPRFEDGQLAGRWCADFLKGFREGNEKDTATPAPPPDLAAPSGPPDDDGTDLEPGQTPDAPDAVPAGPEVEH